MREGGREGGREEVRGGREGVREALKGMKWSGMELVRKRVGWKREERRCTKNFVSLILSLLIRIGIRSCKASV